MKGLAVRLRRTRAARVFAACVLSIPGAARADWFEASGNHFVVYSDNSEADTRRTAEYLERYDAALHAAAGIAQDKPSPSNRVTIYTVPGGINAVQQLSGPDSRNLAGFYLPRAGNCVAFLPHARVVRDASRAESGSFETLLHEYAHHFSIGQSSLAAPRWVSEGGAEFFAQAAFPADGSVEMGNPAAGRWSELTPGEAVSVLDLLDPARDSKRKGALSDSFYGRSWLLYHYLMFEPARAGQMSRYLTLIANGTQPRLAADQAFGDLDALSRDLARYLQRPGFRYVTVKSQALKVDPVTVRRLRPAEVAILPLRIRSDRGVSEGDAAEVAAKAREVAARFPADPGVLAELAEAEYDSGHDDAAIAAADAALAAEPGNVTALVQRGLALFRKAEAARGNAAEIGSAWQAARAAFVRLNRLENDHPLPLIYYYRSFVTQTREPPAAAITGVERALELAPFDDGLRMEVAMAQLRHGAGKTARMTLMPLANSPHEAKLAVIARDLVSRIEANPSWNGAGYIPPLSVLSDDGAGS